MMNITISTKCFKIASTKSPTSSLKKQAISLHMAAWTMACTPPRNILTRVRCRAVASGTRRPKPAAPCTSRKRTTMHPAARGIRPRRVERTRPIRRPQVPRTDTTWRTSAVVPSTATTSTRCHRLAFPTWMHT
uniref:(northern house mosquito) hypothetical protein n=1 Tax=Culex pipiens TaxID=7175 RepID=A0A8D8KZM7_CULPI